MGSIDELANDTAYDPEMGTTSFQALQGQR